MELLQVEIEHSIAVITITRPEQLNALNKAIISKLSDSLDLLRVDKNVRVIIITGAGEKAFVAGADIKEFVHYSKEEGQALSAEGHKILFNKIAGFPKPVIAAINGYALGGGLELALAAHIRLASKNAKLGLPEATLGLIPGYGGTQRLTQIVGKGIALEMMLAAQMISSERALAIGLVNHVFELAVLQEEAIKLAKQISKNAPSAVSKVLEAVNNGTGLNAGLAKEIELFGACFGTADFIEGTSAFLEKRKPSFQ